MSPRGFAQCSIVKWAPFELKFVLLYLWKKLKRFFHYSVKSHNRINDTVIFDATYIVLILWIHSKLKVKCTFAEKSIYSPSDNNAAVKSRLAMFHIFSQPLLPRGRLVLSSVLFCYENLTAIFYFLFIYYLFFNRYGYIQSTDSLFSTFRFSSIHHFCMSNK